MDKVGRLHELQTQLATDLSAVEREKALRIAIAAAYWGGVEAAGAVSLDPAVWGELFELENG